MTIKGLIVLLGQLGSVVCECTYLHYRTELNNDKHHSEKKNYDDIFCSYFLARKILLLAWLLFSFTGGPQLSLREKKKGLVSQDPLGLLGSLGLFSC